MDVEAGLLCGIMHWPDDDTPRLVYADWLDEHGQPERAEFIRVQCEMAAIPDPPPEPTIGARSASREQRLAALMEWKKKWRALYYRLRERERELLAVGIIKNDGPRDWHRWLPEAIRPDCKITVLTDTSNRLVLHNGDGPHMHVEFGRGFPVCLSLSWRTFAGRRCELCDGSGRHETSFLSDETDVSDDCRGRSRAPGVCDVLVWRPEWRMQCPECEGTGCRVHVSCCSDGLVPRPTPPQAVPLEKIVLTTMPAVLFRGTDHYALLDQPSGKRYARSEVGRVEEVGLQTAVKNILSAEWPGIAFKLPNS